MFAEQNTLSGKLVRALEVQKEFAKQVLGSYQNIEKMIHQFTKGISSAFVISVQFFLVFLLIRLASNWLNFTADQQIYYG